MSSIYLVENITDMFRAVFCKINKEKNGIELIYSYMPSIETRNMLKKAGWRWNPNDQVWYARYSEEALTFAKKQTRETEKRKLEIDKMPVFYRKHCGCQEDYLLLLQEEVFHKYVKFGSLKSIALELLHEYIFDDALSLFRELYIQATKNESYRQELITKTPKELYLISKDGEISLRYPKSENPNDICYKLGLKQSTFWENLKIFGVNLKPVDRIAYRVSNYRDSCISSNKSYYSAESIQERYLLSIVNELTLNYNDTLSKIIKNHLRIEIDNILEQDFEKNYYILTLYALIVSDRKQAESFLSQYVDYITPKQVILNVEQKRKTGV